MNDISSQADLNLKPLGDLIRRLRKDLGWSQAELAQQSGVSRQEISMMENYRFTGSVIKVNRVLMAMRYRLTAEVFRYPTIDEIDEMFNND